MTPAGAAQTELYDDLAYTYDGSVEGLLSAIFAAYERHQDPSDIAPEAILQPRLGQTVVRIETDAAHALRMQRGLTNACGKGAFEAVKYVGLSDEPTAGTAAYRFVRYAMDSPYFNKCKRCKRKGSCGGVCSRTGSAPSILDDLTNPNVEPVVKIARAVDNERHRMLQFLRFQQLEGGLWYAQYNPKASVVPLVMGYFSARFNIQPFIIYDEVHHLAGVYEGRDWYLVNSDIANLPDHDAKEQVMQDAWRTFYHTVAVEARYNPELRRHFMPKRLWKNLTELQP